MLKINKNNADKDSLLNGLTSIEFNHTAFSVALLIVRLCIAGLMLKHGLEKIIFFNDIKEVFPDPLRIGSKVTLVFSLLIESIFPLFIIVGLFTRAFIIPLIIQMIIIIFFVHFSHKFSIDSEVAILYLCGFVLLFAVGPGEYSIDAYFQHKMGNFKLENDESDKFYE